MSLFESFNLGHGFRKYFTIEQAHDPAALDTVFRLRHQVFCKDLGIGIASEDGRSHDDFDAASLHCLIRDIQSPEHAVACARLILGERLPAGTPLPFELAARALPLAQHGALSIPDRSRIGEISMLAVRRSHHRRNGEETLPISIRSEDFAAREQPRFPFLPVGLYLGTLALAADRGLETLFMIASPRLATHLGKLGIALRPLGQDKPAEESETTVVIDVARNISAMPFLLQPMWEAVRHDLRRTPLAP